MKYLKDFSKELEQRYQELFNSGVLTEPEDFYRDSERFRTLDDLINLSFEDMEVFYDQAGMGEISR
jgi:hypothetical protein